MLTDQVKRKIVDTAHALADVARIETLKHFRGGALGVENKVAGGFDPVTVADRAAETAMRAVLAKRRPDDAIMGEEFGATPGTTGLTWVLDPIDGTRGYLSGTPTWGVLIAVQAEAGPIFGIIDQPFTGERFIGGFGIGAWERSAEHRALKVRTCTGLSQAIVFSTFPEVGTADEGAAFKAVASQAQLVRFGTDCYAYGLLALGQIDLVVEAGLQNYDIQAPMAVIEAAGGIVTNWQGGPCWNGGRVLAAGDPATHRAALEILKTC
ncbi:MAG: inositol monophosphatase family protein [Paracoccaceae bacterium]